MIILHAGETDDMLTVWAESSNNANLSSHHANSKRKRSIHAPQHPFAASFDDIYNVFTKSLLKDMDIAYHECQVTVWLPTRTGNPIPSSRIIAESAPSGTKTSMAPWTVMACRFYGNDAVNVLHSIMGKRILSSGVMVGNSLSYWSGALRLASSMVSRQQFLPDLIERDGSYRAVWNPVFVDRDAERLTDLARRMPAACRAITVPDIKDAPKKPPVKALVTIVSGLVDAMVRDGVVHGASRSRSRGMHFDSIHDAWFHALSSYDERIGMDAGELSKFSAHVREWRHPISVLSGSSFRLCFRLVELEESKDPSGTWQMQYLVHPHNDPSLLVSAGDLWDGKTTMPSKNAYGAKELLFIYLGHASELSGIIAAGLKTDSMSGFIMNTAEAYAFLKEDAVALKQAGYGIMLPPWWTGSRTKARISVQANIKRHTAKSTGAFSLDTVVQFDWEAALGNQKMTLKELERLAGMKVPLVKIRGQWIDANDSEIRAIIEILKKAPKKATMQEAIMMDLKGRTGTQEMPKITITSSVDQIDEVLQGLNKGDRLRKQGQPEGFAGTLRPYQLRGYSWLSFLLKWRLGGCLADDMGLGKTVQMLALIQQYVNMGASRPVLLVCPMSLIENWRKEAARFVPELSVMIHHGAKRKTDAAFKKDAKKHALVISSYGLAQRDISFIKGVCWGGVVLDEAQNIKNHDTKQSQAVRALNAEFRFAMTGTPVENNVGDLWSIMNFLNPGFLGTQKEFTRNFFVPIHLGHDDVAAKQLRQTAGPFVLRRLKTDKSIITDLPDKMEMKVYCQLTKEQVSLYSSVLKEFDKSLGSAEDIQRKGIILGVISKLKQICNHPAQFLKDSSSIGDRSGKMARLTDMLAEAVEAGDRILVFTQFAEMGYIIQKHIQETFGLDVLFLHGGVSRTRRAQMIEQFQDVRGDEPRVFVLSLKAGGTGLNLTAANRVIHFDRWWNPAVEDQATDRAFRIGQTQNVQVHKFVCTGTLEEKIDDMIERKKQISENVVGTGEGWLTKLSNDDLRDVLSLDKGIAVM